MRSRRGVPGSPLVLFLSRSSFGTQTRPVLTLPSVSSRQLGPLVLDQPVIPHPTLGSVSAHSHGCWGR